MRRMFVALGLGTLILGLAIQAVPYGRDHTNPPVVREPRWDRPETRALAARACFDCHSNETRWPWYSSVAPVSWLVQRDVDEGRRAVNFSEWHRPQREAHESAEHVAKGDMPPWFYTLPRPGERLTASERRVLVAGLQSTLGTEKRPSRGRDGDRSRHD